VETWDKGINMHRTTSNCNSKSLDEGAYLANEPLAPNTKPAQLHFSGFVEEKEIWIRCVSGLILYRARVDTEVMETTQGSS